MSNSDNAVGRAWAARTRDPLEPPSREFFFPGVEKGAEARDRWSKLAEGFVQECRPVYSLTYQHDGSDIEVTVGHVRTEWRPKRGPRGGRQPGLTGPHRTGTKVVAIVDAGYVIEVWSEPPYGVWANPSLVGPAALRRIQYFKPPDTPEDTA